MSDAQQTSDLRAYLGDGVYVVYEMGSIVLTTEDGIKTLNQIVLAPEVFDALVDWGERAFGERL